ncbi:hypothetical protein ACLI1A_07440 [Flavobacterium sp. RHBU_3]|uniref:hypothetical protein n=1 Tax=Flavobacterium sp. RHBU_3 TaxID=3391184 RepID=UPI003984EF44
MQYDYAKSVYDELKNFEGKATFEGSDVVIEYFVLMPKPELEDFSLPGFLDEYKANSSFEIEGPHDIAYTIIGISTHPREYTDDADYLARLIVG